jgi:hypothetical protein
MALAFPSETMRSPRYAAVPRWPTRQGPGNFVIVNHEKYNRWISTENGRIGIMGSLKTWAPNLREQPHIDDGVFTAADEE